MPLTDLVRYLNSHSQGHTPALQPPAPFLAQQGKVLAHFANLQLASQFLPIVETATGQVHGHAASLQAFNLNCRTALEPHAVFVPPSDDAEFIYLDRLVRGYQRPAPGCSGFQHRPAAGSCPPAPPDS